MEAKPYLQQISLKRESVPFFDAYPFHIPAIKNLESMVFHRDVTFIIGENGSGKSTLIEAIALHLGFSIEGGSKSVQTQIHHNASVLFDYLSSAKSYRKPSDYFFLRAESFYNIATYLEELDKEEENYGKGNYVKDNYGVKSLHECSHGESFMATLTHRLSGNGLYIFDEPEAALSPARQLAALSAIHELVQTNSQFIIATHSPILLAYPNAVIYQLGEDGMRQVKYEETEHFQITQYFLNNHEAMTRTLMGDPLNLS